MGIQSVLDYSALERIAYIKSYSEICLVPSLHLNQVTFIGQRLYNYIAVKQDRDCFYGLVNVTPSEGSSGPAGENDESGHSQLQQWDILTGKQTSAQPLPEEMNFTKYERFTGQARKANFINSQQNGHTLLVSKSSVDANVDESMLAQYFDPELLEPKFYRQDVYYDVRYRAKQFQLHEFRMIEITGVYEVTTHFSFIYPKFAPETRQRFFFNRAMDLMLEWRNEENVVLFQRRDVGRESQDSQVRQVTWNKMRRMVNLTKNFGKKHFLEHVSPDFVYFIDVDLARRVFIVRDLRTEVLVATIPSYLLDLESGTTDRQITEKILRVKWVSNEKLKILSEDGLERLVALELRPTLDSEGAPDGGMEANFVQVGFNQMQNFDYEQERFRNVYFDRQPLAPARVVERLIRRCQDYKSA